MPRSESLAELEAGLTPDLEDLEDEVSLLELLDRVIDKGVVVSGDITLAVAGIDLIEIDLRAVLSATETRLRREER